LKSQLQVQGLVTRAIERYHGTDDLRNLAPHLIVGRCEICSRNGLDGDAYPVTRALSDFSPLNVVSRMYSHYNRVRCYVIGNDERQRLVPYRGSMLAALLGASMPCVAFPAAKRIEVSSWLPGPKYRSRPVLTFLGDNAGSKVCFATVTYTLAITTYDRNTVRHKQAESR
jgi:hypothetical protein